MGEAKVKVVRDQKQMQNFVRHLLRDVDAFDYMLKNDWFESDITRIGAEQEMCLVNKDTFKPACINMAALEKMKGWDWVTTELAQFNLETNLTPLEFKGNCLREMERENTEGLQKIRDVVREMGAEVVLTGILPTLRKSDLDLSNLTPKPRYLALMESIKEHSLRGDEHFELRLDGIDELHIRHDSPLLEACNTSFQVHLQVSPKEYVKMYNIAQMLLAPIISISANSPLVFGRRLWHETRIALFQQALDTRTSHEHLRERRPRVNFGNDWLHESILEIHRDDISRFRVLLGDVIEEDSLEMIAKGKTPKLRALQIFNSTVYRWNRPCYGISPNGKPHLRIECRVLPAGPSVVDSTANAAFWLGLMIGYAKNYGDVTKHIGFEDIRDNFDKAAKFGFDTKYTWFNDRKVSPQDLILNELLPIAREGLTLRGVDEADISRYMDIIEERAKAHMTGARWQLRAFTKLTKEVTTDEAVTTMTAAIAQNQWAEKPVHTWTLPEPSALEHYMPSKLKVEEFMQTDLFTAQKEDIIEFVAQLMDWRNIRFMPIEDSKGQLVGLVTSRLLLRALTQNNNLDNVKQSTVAEIMIENPKTITPDATLIEALKIMRDNRIGCLPVVNKSGELVGIITEMDFLRISVRLIERVEK
ncbi:MAG: CBS domain-containing protein [Saprospiraceae bacterium]|nr:CBS domain-containing protein [Saprospiraceae bacterium]